MTKTATMQVSNSVVEQAIKQVCNTFQAFSRIQLVISFCYIQVVVILPDFEVYAPYDYWPLELTVHRVLRSTTNGTQGRRRKKEERQAEREQAECGQAESESNGNVDEDDMTNSRQVEEPTHLEAPSMAVHIPEVPNAPVTAQNECIAGLTQGLGDMSVDPVQVQGKFVYAQLELMNANKLSIY
jgi:hypothetical protein